MSIPVDPDVWDFIISSAKFFWSVIHGMYVNPAVLDAEIMFQLKEAPVLSRPIQTTEVRKKVYNTPAMHTEMTVMYAQSKFFRFINHFKIVAASTAGSLCTYKVFPSLVTLNSNASIGASDFIEKLSSCVCNRSMESMALEYFPPRCRFDLPSEPFLK